jgi:SAM-dependent methyltransferase
VWRDGKAGGTGASGVATVPRVTYLSPLAYLLGIEGAAILRGIREGTADRAFVETRIAEIRALLDTPGLADAGGVTAVPGGVTPAEVYRDWAPSYDQPGNGMIDIEQPIVRTILDGLPVGTALDAACGTGRHAAYLAQLGHHVIGVDQSREMLDHAARRLPEADLRQADLDDLPLGDDTVDVVVCALALTHVPDLAPVLAEFARVLRPGGHLVISDPHLLLSYLRPTMPRPGPDGQPTFLLDHQRPLSEYLAVALPLGFHVRRCEEPGRPPSQVVDEGPAATDMSWDLLRWCPDAAIAAHQGAPVVVIWHFQLAADR